ncbi:MAG: NAD(P)H-binding protein [Gemmatimonadota bacterium]|nr:NAD(P)H-binding protein [Gemmatimonadota bacterium]
MSSATRHVFITGATGYLGRALSAALVARGHAVNGLCRSKSRHRLAAGVTAVIGDPLDADSYTAALRPDHVVVHLVGTRKPAPWKGASFERVDLGSVAQLSAAVAKHPVAHIVYVSVAHPAPAMHAYIAARVKAEALLAATAIPLTIVRPWYILGPGHWWPIALIPFYRLAERIPATRSGALRLGLVTLEEMVTALVWAAEHAEQSSRVLGVTQIRAGGQ